MSKSDLYPRILDEKSTEKGSFPLEFIYQKRFAEESNTRFLPPASLGHHSLRESTSMANCIGVVACRWILGFAQGVLVGKGI